MHVVNKQAINLHIIIGWPRPCLVWCHVLVCLVWPDSTGYDPSMAGVMTCLGTSRCLQSSESGLGSIQTCLGCRGHEGWVYILGHGAGEKGGKEGAGYRDEVSRS